MSQHPATLPLESVRDLMAPGAPLPFRVIDAQGRLLLAQGQCVQDVRQLKALLERGACVAYDEVQAVRQAREKGGGSSSATQSTRQLTWFDRWERHIWDIDDALRQVGHEAAAAPLLAQLVQQQMALVASQPDAALFTLLRQDDKRMALYALSHARHTALVVQLTAGLLGWDAERVQCGPATRTHLYRLKRRSRAVEFVVRVHSVGGRGVRTSSFLLPIALLERIPAR